MAYYKLLLKLNKLLRKQNLAIKYITDKFRYTHGQLPVLKTFNYFEYTDVCDYCMIMPDHCLIDYWSFKINKAQKKYLQSSQGYSRQMIFSKRQLPFLIDNSVPCFILLLTTVT